MAKIFQNLKLKVNKIIQHRHFQKYEKYVSLVVWLGVIYFLSSQSLSFLASFNIWEFILRKIFHMFEYAVLAILIFRILGQTEKRHIYWNIFWAFLFAVLYAVSDEYHQLFTAGRVGALQDVLIDSIGALIAIWLIYLNYRHTVILKKKK